MPGQRWRRRSWNLPEDAERDPGGAVPIVDDGLRGRRFIVTGGGSGIGKAVAATLSVAGSSVMIADRDAAALEQATYELARQGCTVASCIVHVEVAADVERMVASTTSELGGIDGLVTSAGVTIPGLALDLSREQFDEVLAVNLTGTFLCSTAVARHLVERGGTGSIVTIASALAFTGEWMHSHYAASKAGVVALTKTLALEWGGHGIRVNCVAPGLIDTPIARSVPVEHRSRYAARTPLGRTGAADDVAKVVRFMLSDDAAYVTGQTITVNGGYTMPS